MPSLKVINGFKGVLDFYVHDGLACVRSWPRSPGPHRAPAVQAGWPAFTWSVKNWPNLSPIVQEAYRQLAAGTNMTARDIFMKSYMKGDTLYLEDV